MRTQNANRAGAQGLGSPLALLAVGAVLVSSRAMAEPVAFPVDAYAVQPGPSALGLQLRITQARMPIGDARFDTLGVKVLIDNREVCTKAFDGIEVSAAILDLDLTFAPDDCNGDNLERLIATGASLALSLCTGYDTGDSTYSECFDVAAAGSVPYASQATYAVEAHEARLASAAYQAHYAHRMSAARPADAGAVDTHAYIDFQSPSQGANTGLFASPELAPGYILDANEAFIAWAPIATSDRRLNICAREYQSKSLTELDDLAIHADTSILAGTLEVAGGTTLEGAGEMQSGLTLSDGDMAIQAGNLTVTLGAIRVGSNADPALTSSPPRVNASSIEAEDIVAENLLGVSHQLVVGTPLSALPSDPGLYVEHDAAFACTGVEPCVSTSTGSALRVRGDVLIGAGATARGYPTDELVVTAQAELTGESRFVEDVLIGVADGPGAVGEHNPDRSELVVQGPTSFSGDVHFENTRATVTFHGPVAIQGNVELNGGVAMPNDSIENASFAEHAVSSAAILDGAITSSDIADGGVSLRALRKGIRDLLTRHIWSPEGVDFFDLDLATQQELLELAWAGWTNTAISGTGFRDVAAGADIWVLIQTNVLGDQSVINTSEDGDSWTARVVTGEPLISIANSPTAGWLISAPSACYFSPVGENGGSWSRVAWDLQDPRQAAHDGTQWIVAQYDSQDPLWASPDGSTWTAVTSLPSEVSDIHLQSIVYNQARAIWIAVGQGVADGVAQSLVLTSEDGVTWVRDATAAVAGSEFRSVAASNQGFAVAVGDMGAMFWHPSLDFWMSAVLADDNPWEDENPFENRVPLEDNLDFVTYAGGFWFAGTHCPSCVSSHAYVSPIGIEWYRIEDMPAKVAGNGAGDWVGISHDGTQVTRLKGGPVPWWSLF